MRSRTKKKDEKKKPRERRRSGCRQAKLRSAEITTIADLCGEPVEAPSFMYPFGCSPLRVLSYNVSFRQWRGSSPKSSSMFENEESDSTACGHAKPRRRTPWPKL